MKEFVIYCDESDGSGKYYSNFYGGLLVRSRDLEAVRYELDCKKEELHLGKEIKWQRVTENYLDKYIELVNVLFDYVEKDIIKLRIMFTQNVNVSRAYGQYQREHKYFLLYYQFVKHGMGLRYANEGRTRVRLYLDKMPDTKEKVEGFRDYIQALNKNSAIRRAGAVFDKEQIAEIDSKEHVLAQGLDVVLGAMQFRLNDKHKEKPPGSRTRGKRTIAKEKLYKHINRRIREIYPNFNVGVSTGNRGDSRNRWADPYRHWLFVPAGAEVDNSKGKQK